MSAPEEIVADRRPRPGLALGAVLLLLLAVGTLAYGPGALEHWRWDIHPVIRVVHGVHCPGWQRVPRGRGPGVAEVGGLRVWHPDTGYLVQETQADEGGRVRTTLWSPDGTVLQQTRLELEMVLDTELRSEPPWLWGAADQEWPSIPDELVRFAEEERRRRERAEAAGTASGKFR